MGACAVQGATIHTSQGLLMQVVPRVVNKLNGVPACDSLSTPAAAASTLA